MFAQAAEHDWIAAVTAWVDLLSPVTAEARLGVLAGQPALRGVRHLIHEEPDPHWILRAGVLESLAVVEERGLVLELPCVFPRHLGDLPELAQRFPRLTIVIDHLGKPPLGTEQMGEWATALRAAAELPNVCAKISGLNTMLASSDWAAVDLRPAVDVAVECFGPDRLMCGSDWPVALLNGDYAPRVARDGRRDHRGRGRRRRATHTGGHPRPSLRTRRGAGSRVNRNHRRSPWSRSLTRRSRRSRI